jgi:tetratricopeptide (TPR) repeat protein
MPPRHVLESKASHLSERGLFSLGTSSSPLFKCADERIIDVMTKQNLLFGIIGLLLGLVIGFMFANSVNKGAIAVSQPSASQTGGLPVGHPDVNSTGNGSAGAVPEVQAAIEKAKAEPNNFDAQVKAAELYYRIKRFDEAIDYLTRANKLNSNDRDTIVHLGDANFEAEKYDEAEKWYTDALAKKPDDVDVRTDLGLSFMFREPPDYDRAIAEFKHSLSIDPNHPQTLQNLTVAYTKKGDTQNASATLSKLEAIDKSNPALSKLRADISGMTSK